MNEGRVHAQNAVELLLNKLIQRLLFQLLLALNDLFNSRYLLRLSDDCLLYLLTHLPLLYFHLDAQQLVHDLLLVSRDLLALRPPVLVRKQDQVQNGVVQVAWRQQLVRKTHV